MRLSILAVLSFLVFAAPIRAQDAVPADAQKVTITNQMVGKAKTWLPAKVEVHAGKPVAITLVNTLKDPHGFFAKGLADAVVLKGGETKTIVVKDPKAGSYPFVCQLHPKHVGGTIDVK
jgi:plastocyanin